jgi:Uma2 family endonuclease
MAIAEQTGLDRRFLLQNISWKTYETFLAELGDRPIRLTYDRGNLELMSPSMRHERFSNLNGRMIETYTEEADIPICAAGSTTFRLQMLDRGLEPDECYYIQNQSALRDRDDIDLNIDPPPDLAVEIDVTRSSLNRMGIYAALGVPEVWRFDGTALKAYILDEQGSYKPVHRSSALPELPLSEIVRHLEQRTTLDDTHLIREFRQWVRKSLSG